MGSEIDDWIANQIDPEIVQIKRIASSVLLDRDTENTSRNFIQGLGLAYGVIFCLDIGLNVIVALCGIGDL